MRNKARLFKVQVLCNSISQLNLPLVSILKAPPIINIATEITVSGLDVQCHKTLSFTLFRGIWNLYPSLINTMNNYVIFCTALLVLVKSRNVHQLSIMQVMHISIIHYSSIGTHKMWDFTRNWKKLRIHDGQCELLRVNCVRSSVMDLAKHTVEKSAALKNNVMTHEKDICILKKGKWNNQSGHYSNRQKKSNLQGALLEGCLRRPY